MPLYHLIGVDAFRACADPAAYRPATYEQDGFIHLTEDANSLLGIANHFYKTVPGDFIVLELDPAQLAGEVRFEAAAPVGNIAPSASIDAALFPHLYGHFTAAAILGELPVRRTEEGTFLSIEYPLSAIVGDHIFLGSSGTAKDAAALAARGISRVLCVAAECDPPALDGVECKTIAVTEDNLRVEEALAFLQDADDAGANVMVYSAFSRCRAVATVLSYGMYKLRLKFTDAHALLQERWPRIALSMEVMDALKKLGNLDSAHDVSIAEKMVNGMYGGEEEGGESLDLVGPVDEGDVENVEYLDENDALQASSDDEVDAEDEAAKQKLEEEQEDAKGVVDMATHTFRFHSDSVYAVAATKRKRTVAATGAEEDELVIASGGGDDLGYLWSVPAAAQDQAAAVPLKGHTDTVGCASFSFDGSLIATGSMDGTVKVWNTGDGSLSKTLEGPGEDVEWVSWHPKGAIVLAGSTDATVWMWTATGRCMQVFSGHEDAVACGQFLPNGKGVITGCADGSVRTWAPKTGKCRHVFDNRKGAAWHERGSAVVNLAVNAASELLLTGSIDGSCRLAHIQNKKVIGTLAHRREGALLGHTVEAVDFSPTMPWCVTAGSAGLVKVWDLSTLSTRYECSHDAGVVKAKFVAGQQSPLLATCSVDQSIRIWDERTGKSVITLTGHTNIVLNFDVVDRTVVSCGDDGVVKVFENCLP